MTGLLLLSLLLLLLLFIVVVVVVVDDRFYIALFILPSLADLLRSHVILHERLAFYRAYYCFVFLNILRSVVLCPAHFLPLQ